MPPRLTNLYMWRGDLSSAITEDTVEERFKTLCEKRGWRTIKFTPHGENGWPDRIVIMPPDGMHVWVELKRPGNHPTNLQLYRLGLLRIMGAGSLWGSNPQLLINQLEEVLWRRTLR